MSFPKLLGLHFPTRTFPGLEITIRKLHDFSIFFHDRTNPEAYVRRIGRRTGQKRQLNEM